MKHSLIRGFALILMASGAALCSAQQISVFVDGDRIQFPDVHPRMQDSRVLVPLRGVFEEMGAQVQWDAGARMVTASKPGALVQLRIGERFATVNGQRLEMDVPAQIFAGRTMVPLRFVSESLGADVHWDAGVQAVRITTLGTEEEVIGGRITSAVTLTPGTVLPARLDHDLRSETARANDPVRATLRVQPNDRYAGLPEGTKLEGRVLFARARQGNDPGAISMEFNTLRLPDGRTIAIDGAMTGLDDTYVEERPDGTLVARPGRRDQTWTYVGYGAGAGILVALLTDRAILTDALLGAALGFLFGQLQNQFQEPRNVHLASGTEVGVRLDTSVVIPPTPR